MYENMTMKLPVQLRYANKSINKNKKFKRKSLKITSIIKYPEFGKFFMVFKDKNNTV
jgi:hypothetical protein